MIVPERPNLSPISFPEIDWQRPWLAPVAELGTTLAHSVDWISQANVFAHDRKLINLHERPIVFTPQAQLPPDLSYEAHIASTAQVPTRDNLHDFFNALAWLHFPKIKRTLNALHAAAFAAGEIMSVRGRQRDAATLFDENAVLFVCSEPAWIDALRRHEWKTVLMQNEAEFFSNAAVISFGHALLEKLVHPYKAITAHAWVVSVDASWFDQTPMQRMNDIDQTVAAMIAQGFSSGDFCHLPVLGVPGWWPDQDRAFYEDASVFRPKRA